MAKLFQVHIHESDRHVVTLTNIGSYTEEPDDEAGLIALGTFDPDVYARWRRELNAAHCTYVRCDPHASGLPGESARALVRPRTPRRP